MNLVHQNNPPVEKQGKKQNKYLLGGLEEEGLSEAQGGELSIWGYFSLEMSANFEGNPKSLALGWRVKVLVKS